MYGLQGTRTGLALKVACHLKIRPENGNQSMSILYPLEPLCLLSCVFLFTSDLKRFSGSC